MVYIFTVPVSQLASYRLPLWLLSHSATYDAILSLPVMLMVFGLHLFNIGPTYTHFHFVRVVHKVQ